MKKVKMESENKEPIRFRMSSLKGSNDSNSVGYNADEAWKLERKQGREDRKIFKL